MFRKFTAMVLAFGLAGLAGGGAYAQNTLSDILAAGKIRIAVDVASPPFGIINEAGEPDGSEVAVARQLAADMGVELELIQVPGPGRIPSLLSGRVDVTISSISTTIQRALAVAYANPHGALEVTIFGPKSVAVAGPEDLAGLRIGVTRATLEEAVVPTIVPEGTEILWFDEISATIQALLSGQVDLISMSGFTEKVVIEANPTMNIERKMVIATAYYAAIVRQSDVELLNFLNTWVFVNTQKGVLADLYKQYTGVDLPPLPTY